jgi:hypothetical protein
MKIADLVKKKRVLVRVRVPAKLQERFGAEVNGTVKGLVMERGVTWVCVKITGGPEQNFRPQDLSPR